jgi:hypothetical protein
MLLTGKPELCEYEAVFVVNDEEGSSSAATKLLSTARCWSKLAAR